MSPNLDGEVSFVQIAGAMNPIVEVAAAVVRRRGRFLVGRRPDGKRHAGLWEFPGGKVLGGESVRDAIARELREELGVGLSRVGSVLFRTRDPGAPFEISFVEAEVTGTPVALEHSELGWFDPDALCELGLAPADRRFVLTRLGAPSDP